MRSMRRSRAIATASRSFSTRTARAPWATTGGAFRWKSHKESGRSAAEVVLTVLHAGGKFEHSAYKVSGGLHGVGISVVNALSEWLEIEIRRQGRVWTQRYEYGVPQGDIAAGDKTPKHGTIVRFKPDAKIFEEVSFSFDTLSNRLRELAFLNKGLKIVIEDERDERRPHLPLQGRHHRVHQASQPEQDADSSQGALLRGQEGRHRGRGGAAVQRRLPGERVFLREQYQYARGRHALDGIPRRAHRDAVDLRAGPGIPQDLQGRGDGRRRARRADGRRVGPHPRPAVRGPDQGQARQLGGQGPGAADRQRSPRRGVRGGSDDRAEDRRQVRAGGAGAGGGAQGARADPQGRARRRGAGRQARRLLGAGTAVPRDLPRRGRLRGRLREAGPRPEDAGRAAAARQDHQCREGALRQGPLPSGNPAPHLGPGNGHRAGRVRRRASSATTR